MTEAVETLVQADVWEVPITDIHFPEKHRIRTEYEDVAKKDVAERHRIVDLADSLSRFGQLSPMVVRESRPEDETDAPYFLLDGGRRYKAFSLAYGLGQEIPGLSGGNVQVIFRAPEDDADSILLEYNANKHRKDFTWQETVEYISRIHNIFIRDNPDGWTHKHTAEAIKESLMTVRYSSSLLKHKSLWHENEEIEQASSIRVAYAKVQSLIKLRDREEEGSDVLTAPSMPTEAPQAPQAGLSLHSEPKPAPPSAPGDLSALAAKLVQNADCREWIEQFEENSFDWCHWDPPYGGGQSGGAHSSKPGIDDSEENAFGLMEDMFPEIYRVLKPGSWLAIWCHPKFTHAIRLMLTGHEKDLEKDICYFCEKPWGRYGEALPDHCSGAEFGFWVNRYPCVWIKDRKADGHDTKRHLINDYETYLLAGKVVMELPELVDSSGSNVHRDIEAPAKNVRRHIMEKPGKLLHEILTKISVKGSLGFDPSVGSASLMEAALVSGRRAYACEKDQAYWAGARATTEKVLKVVVEAGILKLEE
ncbi:MAG: ParB N-terminal domain-containing protein [bacterium]|nr:ParB N-terminal domain-containing protein [bacterium]